MASVLEETLALSAILAFRCFGEGGDCCEEEDESLGESHGG